MRPDTGTRAGEEALGSLLGWSVIGLGRRALACPACGAAEELRLAEDLTRRTCGGCDAPLLEAAIDRLEETEGREETLLALREAGILDGLPDLDLDAPLARALREAGALDHRRILAAEPDGTLTVRAVADRADDAFLDEILALRRRSGGRIGDLVFALAGRTERDALLAGGPGEGAAFCDLDDLELDPDLADLLPAGLAAEHRVVPIERDGECLVCAMANPLDFDSIDRLRLILGLEIRARPADEDAVFRALDRLWPEGALLEVEALDEEVSLLQGDVETEAPWPQAPPGVHDLDRLVRDAVGRDLRRVDLEPGPATYVIRFRDALDPLEGPTLRETVSRRRGRDLVARLAIVAGLGTGETTDGASGAPRLGRFEHTLEGLDHEIAVTICRTPVGDAASLEVRPPAPVDLDPGSVGIFPADRTPLEQLASRPGGLVVFASPPGGGRSRTLAAVLRARASGRHRIVTLEADPRGSLAGVTRLPLASAREARDAISGLRPDTLGVDPLDDPDVARVVLEAALDGAWVGVTVVAGSAAHALRKLRLLDAPSDLLDRVLVGVVAGRLLPRLCPGCTVRHRPDPASLSGAGIPVDLVEELDGLPLGIGCAACDDTGSRDRGFLFEVLSGPSLGRTGPEGPSEEDRSIETARLRTRAVAALRRDLVAWPELAPVLG